MPNAPTRNGYSRQDTTVQNPPPSNGIAATIDNEPAARKAAVASVPPTLHSTNSLDPVLAEEDRDETVTPTFKLSKRRWFVLFAMGVFGFTLAASHDTSPILNLILQLLDWKVDKYIYVSQIFGYAMAITTIPTAWFVDKYGIQMAIYSALGLYMLANSLEALLYSPTLRGWATYRIYYYLVAGFISTQVFSVYFLLPLKVSETWFSSSERSLAWTIMIAMVDLGTCLASFLYPRLMPSLDQIGLLAYVNIIGMIVTVVVCLACITTAAPKNPPSERYAKAAREQGIPLKVSIKRMLTNQDVVLHIAHGAILSSCQFPLGRIIQDVLVNLGQTTIFAGNLMSAQSLVAIFMLVMLARFVHRIENVTLACKLAAAAQVLAFILFLVSLIFRCPGWFIIFATVVQTIVKCWSVQVHTNMIAHLSCGLVSQATIMGLSATLTILTMTVIQVAFVAMIDMKHKTSDYTQALIFLAIVAAVNEVIYQIFFRGRSVAELESQCPDDRVANGTREIARD